MTRRLIVLWIAAACLLAAAALAGAGLAPAPAGAHPSDSATDTDHDSYNSPAVPGQPADNCPEEYNADQSDLDGDGDGDKCDLDDDQDGVEDITDNCQEVINPGQQDLDGDGDGDSCDTDDDGDGVVDRTDNCPRDPNRDQADADGDRLGDACDSPVAGQPGPGPPVDPPQPPVGGDDGGDGGGDGGGAPPAEPPADDRTGPELALSVARRQRLEAVERGMSLAARCSERCVLVAQVSVDRAGARRLRLGRKAQVVGVGRAALDGPGRTFVFAPLSRKVVRGLSRGRARKVSLEVRLVATDAAGNNQTLTRTIQVRR